MRERNQRQVTRSSAPRRVQKTHSNLVKTKTVKRGGGGGGWGGVSTQKNYQRWRYSFYGMV